MKKCLHTRHQAHSKAWFQQRTGRVTASRLKSADCTNVMQPQQYLIKVVCYLESACFKSNATIWDSQHEEEVCREYESMTQSHRIDFSISKSVLVIHESYPFMSASPDGTINCECYGHGVLEIKCPNSERNPQKLLSLWMKWMEN